jgi:hypothetical protein
MDDAIGVNAGKNHAAFNTRCDATEAAAFCRGVE